MHSEKDLAEGFEFHALTDKGLQFTFEGIEIEIMVSPNWRKPADFYTFLETLRPAHRKLWVGTNWQVIYYYALVCLCIGLLSVLQNGRSSF